MSPLNSDCKPGLQLFTSGPAYQPQKPYSKFSGPKLSGKSSPRVNSL